MKKQILTLASVALATGALIIASCKKDDTTPPVITLIGNASMSLSLQGTYTEQGATAEDNEDGNLTTSITTSGTVNTNARGSYTIHYSVKDAAGNEGTADRSVAVVNDAEYLVGTYTNVRDSVWGSGSGLVYTDVITSSDTNNTIWVHKFGDYQNGLCRIMVVNTTQVSVPTQNVTCGSPAALRTFLTPSNGTISGSPSVIQFDYQEVISSTSTSTNARATYNRN